MANVTRRTQRQTGSRRQTASTSIRTRSSAKTTKPTSTGSQYQAAIRRKTFQQTREKKEHKKTLAHRQAVRNEVKRLGTNAANDDLLIRGMVESTQAAETVIRTSKAGYQLVKGGVERASGTVRGYQSFRNDRQRYKRIREQANPKQKLQLQRMRTQQQIRTAKKTVIQGSKAAAAKTAAASGRAAGKAGTVVTNSMYSSDHSNSTAGTVNLAARSYRVGKETASAIKTARETRQAHKNQRRQRLAKREIKKRLARQRIIKNSKRIGKGLSFGKQMISSLKLFVSNPTVIFWGAIIASVALIFFSIASVLMTIIALPANYILADDDVMASYTKQFEELEKELNDQIEALKNNGYDSTRVDYVGPTAASFVNRQEILALLAVIEKQELEGDEAELEQLQDLYHQSWSITTRTERYTCGSEGCEGHTRLVIEVYIKTLEEMMELLEFTDDEMELAINLAGQGIGEGGSFTVQGNWINPAPDYVRLSSPYGYRIHPISGKKKLHTGMDLASSLGSRCVASNAGTVIYAGTRGGYGLTVMIDHGNGITSLYAHNSTLLVSNGEKVAQGQQIAKIGSTGNSTGPHCHFEIRINGSYVDPAPYLAGAL